MRRFLKNLERALVIVVDDLNRADLVKRFVQPDLVLAELNTYSLPFGLDFLARLTDRLPFPVPVLTIGDAHIEEQARQAGSTEFFAYPFEGLTEAMQRVLQPVTPPTVLPSLVPQPLTAVRISA